MLFLENSPVYDNLPNEPRCSGRINRRWNEKEMKMKSGSYMFNTVKNFTILFLFGIIAMPTTPCLSQVSTSRKYLEAVQDFADTVIDKGRDTYGDKHTPLFVDGLHAVSLKPAVWKKDGQSWVLSNFASQQPLIRVLDGLSTLTGDARYRQAAADATGYALKHLQSRNGLLYWGGHVAWDLETERAVGQYAGTHEMKGHQPYYRFMWEVDPDSTRKLMGTIWATHILDWSRLDYNRHANTEKPAESKWNHEFAAGIEVPFPTEGSNLSFANVTPPLMHSGTMLAALDKNTDALKWTRRLVYRWQQAKHPETGLCGGQLSYREHDRAQDALGHVHPSINEAKIVASYHQTSRYHHMPLAQMQAAETLLEAGGKYAETGREFISWAIEDLKVYADRSYDPDSGKFVALMIDGTALKWRQAKTGYYIPQSFAPRSPDGHLLWSYAMAYRISKDEDLWKTVRTLTRTMRIGDIGSPKGRQAFRLDTDNADWRVIYALLELHRATGNRSMLRIARNVADNLLKLQTPTALFPRPGRDYARTGDEIPLALLHLAAALEGASDKMPPPTFDSRFFHCEYHGQLDEDQKKRADKRTYDNYVFYGSP
jgi:pectate lyase